MATETRSTASKVKTFFLGDEAKSREEKRLVQKIDFFILTYCCLSYFFNFLDRAAFANAYVAGLREALHMKGHDYNTVLSVTTAGMVIGQTPHGMIIGLQLVRPKIWLPSMVLFWAFLTMATAAVKTTTQLCVIRFLLGLAEASTYSGAIYIMGSWYKPQEISKRTAIFTASGQIGTMFAGVMMTAIYKGMGGLAGLGGWQWVFIIDGIITLPIAIFGYFYFPDIPENTSARYLSESEKTLAVRRLPPVMKDSHKVNPFSLLKRLALMPTFWVLVLWSPVCATLEAWVVQGNFILWLKYHAEHFTQTQINTYPLGVQAVGIVTNILAAWHMDATGTRVPMVVLVCIIQIVCAAMLLVPTLPFAGTMFAFYLSGSSYMVNPLVFGWASIILQRSGDEAVRSMTIYAMNIGSTTLYTFWGIALFAADEAPYWKKGAISMIVCSVVVLGFMGLVIKIDKDSLAKYGSMTVDDFEASEARQTQAPPDDCGSGSDDQKAKATSTNTPIEDAKTR
ncbi:major facilitator superfamily transporter [Colletotrichum navitas]|uniref:Major facilitator superfamily transporter n=1 Tax=Colletotrichum navitas TaxID=681940 RepID=A0AAD8V9F4_9PEZI|nr:major facilitator superfamily transporter [Colletotrichum navitas]KAK1596736.1 major facilitator superfamily transporter [Colletotrichum navitas]